MSEPVARILATDLSKGKYVLENNTDAPFAEKYYLVWFLELAGYVIDKGILDVDAPAGGKTEFEHVTELPQKGMCTLFFSAVSRADTDFAPREREFAFTQFVLRDETETLSLEAASLPMKAEETESLFAVHSPCFAAAFAKKTLLPMQIVYEGTPVLSAPVNAESEYPIRLFRPEMKKGTAIAHLRGLWAALEGETAHASGSFQWTVNGAGKMLLESLPTEKGMPLQLLFPLPETFDYVEFFADCMEESCDGAQRGPVLMRSAEYVHENEEPHTNCRELSVSSGEVTLSIKPEKPICFWLKDGLHLKWQGDNRIMFALENEHM